MKGDLLVLVDMENSCLILKGNYIIIYLSGEHTSELSYLILEVVALLMVKNRYYYYKGGLYQILKFNIKSYILHMVSAALLYLKVAPEVKDLSNIHPIIIQLVFQSLYTIKPWISFIMEKP